MISVTLSGYKDSDVVRTFNYPIRHGFKWNGHRAQVAIIKGDMDLIDDRTKDNLLRWFWFSIAGHMIPIRKKITFENEALEKFFQYERLKDD